MQAELQTALFQAFDTLNLQRVKTFSVPPVTLCGLGALSACGQEAQARGVSHLFVMVDSFLHQAGMSAGLERSLAMIGQTLPKAVGYGHDLAARESMLLASCMAGMAFSSAGLGLCHAMAHQPGAALHIPHGQANAMLLPTVMEFNRMVRRERFSQIGRALTGKKTDDREAIAAVRELTAEVGLSKRLSDAGALPEHFSAWAQAALGDICLRTNPRTANQEQIIQLYTAAQ